MGAVRKMLGRLGLEKTRIRRQMNRLYAIAVLIPLTAVGVALLLIGGRVLNNHYIELLEADNLRVKSLLTEVTTAAYQISDEVCYDSTLIRFLDGDYENSVDFVSAVNSYDELDSLVYNAAEVEAIYIYSDNPSMQDYKQFRAVTDEIAGSGWYGRALGSAGAFWVSIEGQATYTGSNSNLCLVRRMTLSGSEYHAVVVIRVSDSYIHSRVDSGTIVDAVSVDDYGIVYSSKRNWYGQEQPVQIDYADPYFRYSGTIDVGDSRYFTTVSTTHLYMTNSSMYVCTMDSRGVEDIQRMISTWALILILIISVPGLILAAFANYFAGRVNLLREEMRKARNQDYGIISEFGGNDELTEAFYDLKVMVQDIKDKDAKMYEAELHQQELRNNQQVMEYKMLASQINPHYLYNTLETIRMKALAGGNREVADSIKILGKTLHYVLENTGTAFTTLKKELEHVENYLSIQKMRFGQRINYTIRIQPELDTQSYTMLPLLLQPVVENAVVHGLEELGGPGMITIDASLSEKGHLLLSVSDDGKGITQEEIRKIRAMLDAPEPAPQSGIALYNIHRRIRLSCGGEYGVRLESEFGGGTRVVMVLPGSMTGNVAL